MRAARNTIRRSVGGKDASSVVGCGYGGDFARRHDKLSEDITIDGARELCDVEVVSEESDVFIWQAKASLNR